MTTPEMGVHYRVPFSRYLEWDAMNASTLVWAHHSAEHLRAAIDGLIKTDSRARQFGRAVHCRLLEPVRYREEYLISQPCGGILGKSSKRAGEECGARAVFLDSITGDWYCGTHRVANAEEPEDFIDADESESIETIAQKVFSHPVVKLIRQEGGFETSLLWKNKSGMTCKARLDKYIPKTKGPTPAIIVDVKKCRRGMADQLSFGKSVASYDYLMRAAWYCDAVSALTGEHPVFIWVAIEDSPPHAIGVYQAEQWQLDMGRRQYQHCVAVYRESVKTGVWLPMSRKIEHLVIPDWYAKIWEN